MAVAYAISIIGIGYWYAWSVWLPRRGGYALRREWVVQKDGVGRGVFVKTPVSRGDTREESIEAEEN